MAWRSILVTLMMCLTPVVLADAAASISVSGAWARPLPPVVPNGAVYMEIVNNGATPDRGLGSCLSHVPKPE